MKLAILPFVSVVCAMLSFAEVSADVETFYHDNIAGRKSGVYEQDGTVYFHTRSVRTPSDDESTCRRKALLTVHKMMFEWVSRHAPTFETMPKNIKRIDSLCAQYGPGVTSDSFSVHVSGRGFTAETDGMYIYGFAAPLEALLQESSKGVPGKTEKDIVARWKVVCAHELRCIGTNDFLEKVGCGSLTSVPQEFADKLSAECAFLDGWNASSQIVKLLNTTRRIDLEPEDLWTEGIGLIGDLKGGKTRLSDSGMRLRDALTETPGSPILWCYLGRYLKERRLYRLSAVAYKNAFCLSADIGLLPLLKSSSANLSYIYRTLHHDAKADGFDLLSMGVGK